MGQNRTPVIILVLIGLLSGLGGVLGNIASGVLPAVCAPYLWLAWPLFFICVLAGIALAVWQYRIDRRAPPEPRADEPPTWVPQLAEAIKQVGQTAEPSAPPPPAPAPGPAPPRPATDDGFAYDVFISYSHADKDWVRGELLPRLEDADLRVCIDYRDFRPGAPSVTEMERAVRDSRKTVLVLTPAWVGSNWTAFESLMLQTDDPTNQGLRLIPLLKEPCDIPSRIRILTYVNFVDPEEVDWAWRQLLTGLGAAPPPEAPEEPTRQEWCLKHPYPMPPHFTGRVAEREMLTRWLHADHDHPLLVIRALGGFGKSALAWHWLLHDVSPASWPHVVWWSFYDEREFDAFLRDTLDYLGVDPRDLSPRQQADALLGRLRLPGTLLVLDGFERALRAYGTMNAPYQGDSLPPRAGGGPGRGAERDCISPLAEHFLRCVSTLPGIQGRVLMTTRLRPRVLEAPGGALLVGCRERELTELHPADAVAFFRARGVRGARAEIERACAPYGYHPLSLSLLAGLILADPQQPGDVAAARRLDVAGDLVARQHHVLERAYETLTPPRQRLLSRIACFRGPVAYDALRAIGRGDPGGRPDTADVGDHEGMGGHEGRPYAGFDADLRNLVARGLLHHDRKTGRYDLHPIVRRYAYDRLGAPDRAAAHTRLRDYFAAVPAPDRVACLEDLNPVIELYHHTVQAEQYDEARRIFKDRLDTPTYYQFGAYQLQIELLRALFPDGEDKPPRLKDESARAWTLDALANSYSLSGQHRRAVPLFEAANDIDEKRGNKQGVAIGLGNLALDQIRTGTLRAAEANLRRRIALCREIEDEFQEAVGHCELGRLLAYRGAWHESEAELDTSLALFEKDRNVQSQGIVWAYRALRVLLLARAVAPSPPPSADAATPSPPPILGEGRGPGVGVGAALHAARRALELADETARTQYPVERDYVRAHWLLGAAHRAHGDTLQADRHLTEALTRCRAINAVETEAEILLDLARLRTAAPTPALPQSWGRESGGEGELAEPLHLAQEALLITERSGYVLQGADVHLFLAELALRDGDTDAALHHAREARRLAHCDGPPDHTYKVAYEEAGALLTRLGEPP